MDEIYLVTTIHIGDLIWQWGRKRTVGWFPTFERAKEVVVNNDGDIYECGHYNHCVIEEVVPGLYPHITRKEWFKWKNGGYVVIKPDKIRVGNIGIG